MKVMSLQGVSFTSQEVLPATCTSKPQVSCTSVQNSINKRTGYSNQEIYDVIVALKNFVTTPFKSESKQNHVINYLV